MERHPISSLAVRRGFDSSYSSLASTPDYLRSQIRKHILAVRFSLRIASLVTIVFATKTAFAATVYSQANPAEPIGAFSSQDITSGQIIADNFKLDGTSATTVRSLRLIGGWTRESRPQPNTDFRVVFMENAGGKPGRVVPGGDFDGGLLTIQSPTGARLLNGRNDPVEYSIDFGDGVSLSPDSEYWMAVMNDPGPAFGWLWARANGVLDNQIATVSNTSGNFTNLPWVAGASGGGMWFELSDQNIPEPSSLLLLLAGCTTLTLFERKVLRAHRPTSRNRR